jgi:hypothetical protein
LEACCCHELLHEGGELLEAKLPVTINVMCGQHTASFCDQARDVLQTPDAREGVPNTAAVVFLCMLDSQYLENHGE